MLNVVNFLRSKLPMLRRFAGSAGSLAIGIVAQAIGFVLLARYLGTVQFGHLVTITAVTALANSWCGFGPGELLRRVVSRDRSMYPQAIGHTVLMILITGIVLSVLVVAGMMLAPVVILVTLPALISMFSRRSRKANWRPPNDSRCNGRGIL